jgi:hypothetical protein
VEWYGGFAGRSSDKKSQDNAVKLDLLAILASSKKCKDADLYWETYQT